jgi:hypothetical protein
MGAASAKKKIPIVPSFNNQHQEVKMMKSKILPSLLSWGLILSALAALSVSVPGMVNAQRSAPKPELAATAFSYQSSLTVKGQPANGPYDFELKLYDAATGGHQMGQTQTASNVHVDNGSFAVFLDFGHVFAGGSHYLEVGVRPGGSSNPFTTLAPRQVVALPGPEALPAQAQVEAQATTPEFWKLGFTSEGASAYNAVIGRVASQVAAFRSNQDTDIFYIFPAPASQKTVQAARFYILDRTGSYGGTATLTLEILDYAGALQHSVSAAGVDMEAAAPGIWTDLTLSGTPADLQISPGEFLAFHFALSGASGGSLDVRPVFEVEVQ